MDCYDKVNIRKIAWDRLDRFIVYVVLSIYLVGCDKPSAQSRETWPDTSTVGIASNYINPVFEPIMIDKLTWTTDDWPGIVGKVSSSGKQMAPLF